MPILVIVTDWAEEFPMTTLPKFSEVGLKEIEPTAGMLAAAVRATDVGEFVAVLTIFTFPAIEPAL